TPCPTGSPSACPADQNCYASTGCLGIGQPTYSPPTRPPSYDASSTFYCGSTFQEASQTCDVPCPSGLSNECPSGQACYANTPCEDKRGFYCGTSIVNASASCEYPCDSGSDSQCPVGLQCYETKTCKEWKVDELVPSKMPTLPDVEEGTKYCGYDYVNAATECTAPCPSGMSEDCPDGMSCYSHTPCEERNTFYCGVSWNNAASSCKFPCPSGTSADCPSECDYRVSSCVVLELYEMDTYLNPLKF
ncbi:hypothetical protein ACHAXS_013507, partial [Conticribra weissflogii]